jgi:hypothetical protein
LSDFTNHIVERLDRAGRSAPASDSVDDLISWVDSIGSDVLQDIFAWQSKPAVIIQLPKRRRRAKKR